MIKNRNTHGDESKCFGRETAHISSYTAKRQLEVRSSPFINTGGFCGICSERPPLPKQVAATIKISTTPLFPYLRVSL